MSIKQKPKPKSAIIKKAYPKTTAGSGARKKSRTAAYSAVKIKACPAKKAAPSRNPPKGGTSSTGPRKR
jgi:hypothetical protein